MAELVGRRQGALPRPVRSQRPDTRAGQRGASDRGPAERVVAVDPRPRGRRARDRTPARHRAGAVQPARARLPHRARSSRADFGADDFRSEQPALPARTSTATSPSSTQVRELAAAKGCTAGQLALAWVLAQGDDVVPIPGTKRTYLSRGERRRVRPVAHQATTSPGSTRSLPRRPVGSLPLRPQVRRQPPTLTRPSLRPVSAHNASLRRGIPAAMSDSAGLRWTVVCWNGDRGRRGCRSGAVSSVG